MSENKFCSIWLSLLIIAVFILQISIDEFTDALILNSSAFIQIWRFLTSIFLHGSAPHLIYNLFALILFGLILEKLIGSKNFLLVFFLSGILANLISAFFYPSSLGASGAIYGILGTLTVLKPKMIIWAFGIPMPMFIASVLWIFADISGLFIPSNTGHIAHLSGIGIGFLLGIIFLPRTRKREKTYKISIPEIYMQNWENRFMR